jgi:hypothetical protein
MICRHAVDRASKLAPIIVSGSIVDHFTVVPQLILVSGDNRNA